MGKLRAVAKKTAALLLALLLCALALPAGLWEGGPLAPAVTAQAAIDVATADQFLNIFMRAGAVSNASYTQTADFAIDTAELSGANTMTNVQYDGGGHTIFIEGHADNAEYHKLNYGLFGDLAGGSRVSNLNVEFDEAARLDTYEYFTDPGEGAFTSIGGIAAKVTGGSSIENCRVSGKLKVYRQGRAPILGTGGGEAHNYIRMNTVVGGIAGMVDGGSIIGCSASSLKLYTGTKTEETERHTTLTGTAYNHFQYMFITGGIAGTSKNGSIVGNVVQDTLLAMGNAWQGATYDPEALNSPPSTASGNYGFVSIAGGLVGMVMQSATNNHNITLNVTRRLFVRGDNDGLFSAACKLVGLVQTPTGEDPGGIVNNYNDQSTPQNAPPPLNDAFPSSGSLSACYLSQREATVIKYNNVSLIKYLDGDATGPRFSQFYNNQKVQLPTTDVITDTYFLWDYLATLNGNTYGELFVQGVKPNGAPSMYPVMLKGMTAQAPAYRFEFGADTQVIFTPPQGITLSADALDNEVLFTITNGAISWSNASADIQKSVVGNEFVVTLPTSFDASRSTSIKVKMSDILKVSTGANSRFKHPFVIEFDSVVTQAPTIEPAVSPSGVTISRLPGDGITVFYELGDQGVADPNAATSPSFTDTSYTLLPEQLDAATTTGIYKIKALAAQTGATNSSVSSYTGITSVRPNIASGTTVVADTEITLHHDYLSANPGSTELKIYCVTGATEAEVNKSANSIITPANEYSPTNPPRVTGDELYIGAVARLTLGNVVYDSVVSILQYTKASGLPLPVPDITNNSVVSANTVLTFTLPAGTPPAGAPPNTQVYYTIDGTNPKTSASAALGTEVVLVGDEGKTVQVKAFSRLAGYSDSEVISLTYIITHADDTLTAVPAAGSTVRPGETIMLRTSLTNGQIYYTTDGSVATTSSNTSLPILVSGGFGTTFTVNAIVVRGGVTVNTGTFTYTIADQEITAAPASGSTVQPGDVITLAAKLAGGTIHYTTDGSVPTQASPSGTSVAVQGGYGASFVINAICVSNGVATQPVTFTYTIVNQEITAAPASGATVLPGDVITLSAKVAGGTIHYTTDGTTPTAASPAGNSIPVQGSYGASFVVSAVCVTGGVATSPVTFTYTITNQEITATPASGATVQPGDVITLATKIAGGAIHYTTDGSNPTAESPSGNSVTVQGGFGKSFVVRAVCVANGVATAPVTFTYTITSQEITATPASGATVQLGSVIMLSTKIAGGSIHYTTDGSMPTAASPVGNSVTVQGDYGASFVVNAVCVSGGVATPPASFTYTIVSQAAPPSASIPNGAVALSGATVTLSAAEGDIYYTTDGSEPTIASSRYTEPILITSSMVLKAIAVVNNKVTSRVAEFVYTLADTVAAPVASVASGVVQPGTKVTLSSATEGALIYYTTNGVDPDTASLSDAILYDTEIVVSRAVILRMVAVHSGMNPSPVNSATYTVEAPEEEEPVDPYGNPLGADRLFSYDRFVGVGEGPLFEQVLRDRESFVTVSSDTGVLGADVTLRVTSMAVTQRYNDAATRSYDLSFVNVFEITLWKGNEQVQPEGLVEIGLPIPAEYTDAVVYLCHIGEGNALEKLEARRGGGMVYALVDDLGEFGVAVANVEGEAAPWWRTLLLPILLCAGAALLALLLLLLLLRRRKRKALLAARGPQPKEEPEPDDGLTMAQRFENSRHADAEEVDGLPREDGAPGGEEALPQEDGAPEDAPEEGGDVTGEAPGARDEPPGEEALRGEDEPGDE